MCVPHDGVAISGTNKIPHLSLILISTRKQRSFSLSFRVFISFLPLLQRKSFRILLLSLQWLLHEPTVCDNVGGRATFSFLLPTLVFSTCPQFWKNFFQKSMSAFGVFLTYISKGDTGNIPPAAPFLL